MSVSSTSNYSLCVPFDLDPMPVITIVFRFYMIWLYHMDVCMCTMKQTEYMRVVY